MNKFLLGIIAVIGVLCAGLIIYSYSEHGKRIEAQQEVATLRATTNSLQEYMNQRDKNYQELANKYRKLRMVQPTDVCGDTVVSEEILEWLRATNQPIEGEETK